MKTIQGHLVRESLSGYLGKLFAELISNIAGLSSTTKTSCQFNSSLVVV